MTPGATAEQLEVMDMTDELQVSSKVLGDLSIPTGQVYTFANGIFGFPTAQTWVLMPAERDGFFWLQSVEFEALTYLLLDPFQFVEGFSVELGAGTLSELQPADAADVLILAILTLPREDGGLPTANLQGPVALNVVKQVGTQAVVESQFGLRHPVEL